MLKYEAWSWEKNKKFELALLEVNEDDPDRWDKVAKIVGGKSAREVEEHYKALLRDLNLIESGVSFNEYNEHSDLNEPQSFQKLVTTTAPLGLCLNVENGARYVLFGYKLYRTWNCFGLISSLFSDSLAALSSD